MTEPIDWNWDRDGKQYHFQEYPASNEVRISVVDNAGYPCHEQVVLPLAIWNAMAYGYVAKDMKPGKQA